ncbi:peptidylprolyl isomerase [Candidatus Omnitrophota bacterium]
MKSIYKINRLIIWALCFVAVFGLGQNASGAQEPRIKPSSEAIGEAFGKVVSASEFIYYYKTASIFTRTGQEDRSEEDIREEAWQNLVFSQEARRLNMTISRQELEEELKRLLSEKDVEFGSNEYNVFVISQFGEDADLFERRIEDLLLINKFMQTKGNPEINVSEEEMKQKFLNQYNSFESEYIKFDSQEEAEKFQKQVQENPGLWKPTYDEKRELGQEGSAWINIMSLEALIDLWKIPKDDAYRILSHQEGDFIAAKFYYGDAVFRLLYRRDADLEKYDEKKQQYYRDLMTKSRKHKITKEYFDELLKRAAVRDYVLEEQLAEKKQALKKKSQVVLETNAGLIELKLFPDTAPLACENFIGLVEKGYYDEIIFHRVIKDFMIQGGDPQGSGSGGESIWGVPFQDEVSEDLLFERPGLLAMANSGRNTNTSQFFITVAETPHLNKKHTIFGEVSSGMEIVQKINSTPTDSNDKPKKEQKIIKAYIKKTKSQ